VLLCRFFIINIPLVIYIIMEVCISCLVVNTLSLGFV
jgi:hypothetical protein